MKRNPAAALPGPAERPRADLLVYDGECRFCQMQMRLLHRLDMTAAIAFLSLHDERSNAVLPGMSWEEKMRAMVLVDGAGRTHAGAKAVRVLSRRMPALWLLAPLLHLPGTLPLWQALYGWIARSRYRLGRATCDGGTCHLHGYRDAR